jgi:hypothetical protein
MVIATSDFQASEHQDILIETLLFQMQGIGQVIMVIEAEKIQVSFCG